MSPITGITEESPVHVNLEASTAALFNVGPGSNPPASLPDPTKGNVAGIWGFFGIPTLGPSQVSSPPTNCGVFGQTLSSGCGVQGISGEEINGGGSGQKPSVGCGVWGDSNSGHGVLGTSSGDDGVKGVTTSQGKAGVSGLNNSVFPCTAVTGSSDNGHGVKGVNGAGSGATPKFGCGVWGESNIGYGVYGASMGDQPAVYGFNDAPSRGGAAITGTSAGIYGESTHFEGVHGLGHGGGAGVSGINDGPAVLGSNAMGVYGQSSSSNGVYGLSLDGGAGVRGDSKHGDGVHGETTSQSNYGVSGLNNTEFPCVAIFGSSSAGHGVKGVNGAGSGATPKFGCGVWGDSQNGFGVYGASQAGTAGYFDGNVSVTGNVNVSGDVILTGADCAEMFDLKPLETADPGSVLVIDDSGALRLCNSGYDTKAAGVVSGAGALRPGIVLDQRGGDEGRITIALVGKVYCKVDADYGPIVVGDLLTSSETPGHAMKVTDPLKGLGSVIGKALQPLSSGRGLVPILVTLQ
jgi:hypothetical protein